MAPLGFAEAFRELVGPALLDEARAQGLRLAVGRVSFEDAYAAVFAIARSRGALFLPVDILDALESWITREVLVQCTEFEAHFEQFPRLGLRVGLQLEAWAHGA